jgi:hypothetical protein
MCPTYKAATVGGGLGFRFVSWSCGGVLWRVSFLSFLLVAPVLSPGLYLAVGCGRGVSALGWRVWLRSGSVGSPVFAACGLPVPAFAVKVALPSGVSVRAARAVLPVLGVFFERYKVLFAASYPPRRHAWLVVRPRVGSVDNSHPFYI